MVFMKMRLFALLFVIAVCAAKSVHHSKSDGSRRAVVTLNNGDINGKVVLEQASHSSPVKIRGTVYGLELGLHGMHVHEGKELGDDCQAVGPHFNPTGRKHGSVSNPHRHVGDLGNIKTIATDSGSRTEIHIVSTLMSLYETSPHNVLDRALVIHAGSDDLGRGSDPQSKSDGNSGPYVVCGLITPANVAESEPEEDYRHHERSKSSKTERHSKHEDKDKSEGKKEEDDKPWKECAPEYVSKIPSNMEMERIARPDHGHHDSFELKSAVPTHRVWKADKIYEYDYSGFISTGIMGVGPKISGGSISGRVVVEPVDEHTINIALRGLNGKLFNEDVLEEFIKANPGQNVELKDREHLEKPIQLKIINGKIESVRINKDEPLWTVNFKRALAAQLQLQLDSSSGVFHKPELNTYYAENAVYYTMEGCTSGECQTWYHISRIPLREVRANPQLLAVPELCENSPVYEIVKNRDFDHCKSLPLFNYISTPGLRCSVGLAGCENAISHVDVVRILGCKVDDNTFVVQRVKTMDRLVNKPFGYETEAVEGLTIQHLHLVDIKSRSSSTDPRLSLPGDLESFKTLTYSYDAQNPANGPKLNQPGLDSDRNPLIMEVTDQTAVSEAERLLSEIVEQLDSTEFYTDPSGKFVADKMDMLRKAISNLDEVELKAFVDRFATPADHWSTINQVMVDTLVFAGTNPALMIIRDWILNGQLVGEQAVQAISMLPVSVKTPTRELLDSFMDLLESDMVTSRQQLKFALSLSFTRIVYQACINTTASANMFPKLVMGEFCSVHDPVVVRRLVPWLSEQLRDATDDIERIAMLAALGNIGHEIIVPAVLPHISSCEPGSKAEADWNEERNRRSMLDGVEEEVEQQSEERSDSRRKWLAHKLKKKYEHMHRDRRDASADKVQSEKKTPLEESEESLTEAAEDQAACNILRTKAIFALSTLAVDKNEIVGKILMPVYFNKEEETEIRLAALSLLFISNPPVAFWERAALSTWTESNDQVAHYVYTTIASLVANKDPKRRDITVRAESVLPMMKPMRWTSFVSSNYLKAGYEEKTRLGYVTKTVNFPGYESFFPSNHYNSIYLTVGPWFLRFADISINSKQPEKFIDRLLGKPFLRNKAERDESAQIHPELLDMQKELKIEARATGKPEIYVYVNLMDSYQRFVALTPYYLENVVQKLVQKSVQRSVKNPIALKYHKILPLLDIFGRVPSAMGLAYSAIAQIRVLTSVKSNFRTSIDVKSMTSVVGKIEGTLLPVVSLEMASKMTAEIPWATSYPTAGVHMETSLALPGRFSLAADIESGKVETSWEFIGDKIRILRHAVVPFATVRRVGDYTPSLLLPETKPIVLLSTPLANEYAFGEETLGLNLVWTERGDVQAIKTPPAYSQDWLGSLFFKILPSTLRFQEQNLWLENAQSETKTIKASLSFASKGTENVKLEEEAKIEDLDQIADDEEQLVSGNLDAKDRRERKFQRLFRTMAQPVGYSLDASVELIGKPGTKSRRFGSSIAYGVGDYGLTHRGKLVMMQKRIESEANEENFVLCVDLDAKMPKPTVVRREEFLRDDISRTSSVKIGFGKSCTDDRKITITTKMVRSEEEIPSTVHSQWRDRECAKQELFGRGVSEECLSTRRLASILNKGLITIDYNEMPAAVRNLTVKASNLFAHWMGAHMSDNQVDVANTPNQIRIETVYYPIIGSMDLRVYKPNSNTFYHGIDIHPVAEAVLPFNPRLTAFRAVYGGPGLCLVDKDSVTTYDGLTYNASMAGCDQIVTKDCSGRYNMAVLSREENDKKIVTVYLNREKIEINAAEMSVKINEKEHKLAEAGSILQVRDASDDILALIRKTRDSFVELDSPSHAIRVTADEKELIILNSPVHRGRLCGLCGSQTGNKVTDLTGPQKCSLPEDLMSAAYELRQPTECKSAVTPGEREMLGLLQERCLKEKSTSVFGLSDSRPIATKFQQEALSKAIRSTSEESECELSRNRMIHRGKKRCFSVKPAVKCGEGCQATGFTTVNMGFHCIAERGLYEMLKEAMAIRPLDELADKEVHTTVDMHVPTGCVVGESDVPSKDHHHHH